MYSDWIATVESGLARFLDNFLMVRSATPLPGATARERYGFLEQNFDRSLLQLFSEVHYWERLHFEIPYVAMDISAHRERYRCLRENVMLVVRDYNSILHALSPQDRRLFSERLHYLDRKIAPGLTKLSWASKGITEVFVKDVRRHCGDVWRLVQTFDSSKRLIGRSCRMVATTSLVLLKKKNIYAQEMFEEEQSSHQRHVMQKFGEVHAEVKGLMQKTYETFRTDGDEVQREWTVVEWTLTPPPPSPAPSSHPLLPPVSLPLPPAGAARVDALRRERRPRRRGIAAHDGEALAAGAVM